VGGGKETNKNEPEYLFTSPNTTDCTRRGAFGTPNFIKKH